MLHMELINKLFFEFPYYQSEWQGISLIEIAKEKNIPLDQVASHDFYKHFYTKLDETGYKLDASWVKKKKT